MKIITVAPTSTKWNSALMIDPQSARPLDEGVGFEAMKLFLEAYWDRGGRTSNDVAVLLGSLDVDPAQRSDWTTAVSRALAGKS